jgi:hypothetical protein
MERRVNPYALNVASHAASNSWPMASRAMRGVAFLIRNSTATAASAFPQCRCMKHKPVILRSGCGGENHQLTRHRKSRENEKFAHSLVARDTGPSNAPLPESLRFALSARAHPSDVNSLIHRGTKTRARHARHSRVQVCRAQQFRGRLCGFRWRATSARPRFQLE